MQPYWKVLTFEVSLKEFALTPFATMQQNICNCAQNFRIGMTFYLLYRMFISVGS